MVEPIAQRSYAERGHSLASFASSIHVNRAIRGGRTRQLVERQSGPGLRGGRQPADRVLQSRLRRWLEVEADVLLGQQCAYHSPPEIGSAPSIAARLCPPPKALAGQPQAARIVKVTPDGRSVYRWTRFLPLYDGDDESAAVVAVMETSDCLPDAPLGGSDVTAAADTAVHEQLRQLRQRQAKRFAIDSLLGDQSRDRASARASQNRGCQRRRSACCWPRRVWQGPRGQGDPLCATSSGSAGAVGVRRAGGESVAFGDCVRHGRPRPPRNTPRLHSCSTTSTRCRPRLNRT